MEYLALFSSALLAATLLPGSSELLLFALLLPGLALVWAGAFTRLHDHGLAHAVIMVAGGLLLAGAHLVNLRLSHGRAG